MVTETLLRVADAIVLHAESQEDTEFLTGYSEGFLRDHRTTELGLQFIWTGTLVPALFLMFGCSLLGSLLVPDGYKRGLDLGLFLPVFACAGLILHWLRFVLLNLVIGILRVRTRRQTFLQQEKGFEAYIPSRFYRWIVTSSDRDLIVQLLCAAAAVVIALHVT